MPAPGPDISVIRGVQAKNDPRRFSFRVKREGVRPCLIVEVVSPLDSKIRRTDLQDKVEIYQRAGIQEYLIVDSTLGDRRFRLLGYRLDASGRYQSIEPDAEGRVLSESTGLWFQVSSDGERVFVFDRTGRRLLNLQEQQEARKEAEEQIELHQAEFDRLRGKQ